MNTAPRAVVIGAGPVGLHTAGQLSQRGFAVTVTHADPTAQPTPTFAAPAAAGLIEPVATAPADEALVADLLGPSLAYWLASCADTDLGADPVDVHFTPSQVGVPDWVTSVMGGIRRPDGTYLYRSVVVTTHTWLREQRRRLEQRGVQFEQRRLTSLREVSNAEVVVNASGPGAWALGDPEMYGRRGPLVWVNRVDGLDHVRFDDSTFTYGIPQRERVALGGAADRVDGNPATWSRTLDAAEAADLLRRARQLFPDADWRRAEVLEATVNYRPCRTRIRLETQTGNHPPIVHATGLGGSGWTLAPALGAHAAELAAQAIDNAAGGIRTA